MIFFYFITFVNILFIVFVIVQICNLSLNLYLFERKK